MTTLLNNLSVVHDNNAIERRQALQAVRDHQQRFMCGDLPDQREDLPFGFGIQPFRRFIQQQHGRIVQQGAGDAETTQLAAGKLASAFAKPGVQTFIFQQFSSPVRVSMALRAASSASGAARRRLSRSVALKRCTRCGTTLMVARRAAS